MFAWILFESIKLNYFYSICFLSFIYAKFYNVRRDVVLLLKRGDFSGANTVIVSMRANSIFAINTQQVGSKPLGDWSQFMVVLPIRILLKINENNTSLTFSCYVEIQELNIYTNAS